MKLVTWNVNSLNVRQEYVSGFLDRVQPDVLALQELKLETHKVPRELFESRGYHLAVFGQPQWNGVLIASKGPIEELQRGLEVPGAEEIEARLLAVRTLGLTVVDVYCPQGQSVESPKFPYKLAFFDALVAWLSARFSPEEALVLLGDYNVAPAARDLYDPVGLAGVPSFHPEEHQRLEALRRFGLEDVCEPFLPAGTYSFWDYRGGAFRFNQGMRIDHIWVTPPLRDRVKGASVSRDDRKKRGELVPSDHAPVILELG